MSALQATWLFSLAVQVAAFSLAIAALSKDGVADAYVFVLWLELAISGAQLVWYSVVYALVFLYKLPNAVNTRWRFVDWAVTTPAMLVTLNVLIKAWHDECLSLSDMWTTEFVVANVAACFFNAIMLLGGYMVESERIEYETEYTVLAASFTPLCLAFLPSVVHVTESYSGTGLAVLLTTFVVWAGYGFVAIEFKDDNNQKASIYNVLDVVSKNIVAVGVALMALTSDARAC